MRSRSAMKLRRSIWCLVFSLLAALPVSGQGDDRTRRELERMAAAYTHISHTTIVMNRELRLAVRHHCAMLALKRPCAS